MEISTIKERLNLIFQDIFDDPALQVTDELTADDVDGWDSLSHMNLIFEVEKTFKIKFTTAEIRGFKNVGDLISVISKKAA